MEATRTSSGAWGTLYAVLLGMASPGMVAVYWVNRLAALELGRSQLWTLAVLSSVLLFSSAAVAARSVLGGVARYALVCLVVIVALAVAHYGFAAQWPGEMWNSFFA